VLKDVGGLTNVLVVFFSIINYPFACFSSLLKAIKKLYLVRTKDKSLLKRSENNKKVTK
jgi:hypothetical protein